MMDLFSHLLEPDITAVKHGGNQESQEAHDRVEPHKGQLREQVLSFVRARREHGATVEEISEVLGLRYATVSARASELKRDGLVRPCGLRRPTTAGSMAAVLVAANKES